MRRWSRRPRTVQVRPLQGARAGSGGGTTVTIGSLTIQIGGEGGDPKAIAEACRKAFLDLVEGAAQQGGGMVPSA